MILRYACDKYVVAIRTENTTDWTYMMLHRVAFTPCVEMPPEEVASQVALGIIPDPLKVLEDFYRKDTFGTGTETFSYDFLKVYVHDQ